MPSTEIDARADRARLALQAGKMLLMELRRYTEQGTPPPKWYVAAIDQALARIEEV